jgi:hypothetical protein
MQLDGLRLKLEYTYAVSVPPLDMGIVHVPKSPTVLHEVTRRPPRLMHADSSPGTSVEGQSLYSWQKPTPLLSHVNVGGG